MTAPEESNATVYIVTQEPKEVCTMSEAQMKTLKDEFGFSYKDKEKPVEKVIIWVFEEGTFRSVHG